MRHDKEDNILKEVMVSLSQGQEGKYLGGVYYLSLDRADETRELGERGMGVERGGTEVPGRPVNKRVGSTRR